ncbi:MAG: T9SS type A sorting domain-containing protein [Flavobacteriales bacterium]|nr:T9SS type A sorting domain-containing protein [Flavobacteriales bacterium]
MRSRPLSLLFALALAAMVSHVARAQEHPFLADYTVQVIDGSVHIDWTIFGGNTCDGQEVERSTDGIHFAAVHRIEGLCGDPLVPRQYMWFDTAPPELSLLHYRVKLGTDGYSSVKTVLYEQLRTTEQRFYPSPTTGEATLLLNVAPGTAVQLLVFDPQGRVLLDLQGLPGPLLRLDLAALPQGTYLYRALANGQPFVGRFVKV